MTAGAALRRIDPRPTGSKVRRLSRPAGEGRYIRLTADQAAQRIYALKRWERRQAKGAGKKNRAVGHIGLDVFGFLANRNVKAKGRLDNLSYDGLAQALGYARSAVVAAVKRLKAFGWLDWFRVFRPTDKAGLRGPQVEQAPNFFWIKAPMEQLLKLGIRLGSPMPADVKAAAKTRKAELKAMVAGDDSPLSIALRRLDAARAKRETS